MAAGVISLVLSVFETCFGKLFMVAESRIGSALNVAIRVCNPGLPKPENPGNPDLFKPPFDFLEFRCFRV